MNSTRTLVVVTTLLSFVVVSRSQVQSPSPLIVREIPEDAWVPIYFESIDQLTKRMGIPALRTWTPPANDIELRIWRGFGFNRDISGYIVRFAHDKWSAFAVIGRNYTAREYTASGELIEPDGKVEIKPLEAKAGWSSTWDNLVAHGVLSLKDFYDLPPSDYSIFDGDSYMIEVLYQNRYRCYLYPNSTHFDNPECREFEYMLGIFRRDVFGIPFQPTLRQFLSAQEVQQLRAELARLPYPLALERFEDALSIRLRDRDLRSNGSEVVESNIHLIRWPLTPRHDPIGHHLLVARARKDPKVGRVPEVTVLSAHVAFFDRASGMEESLRDSAEPTAPASSASKD